MLVVLCRTVLAFKGRGINIRPVTPNIFGNTFSHQGLKTCARTPLHSSGWSFLLVRLRLHVCSVKATFELGNLTSPTCVLESLVSTPWTCWLIQVLRFWGDNKHILSSSFQEVSCIPNNFIGICHQEFNSFQPKLPCPRLAIETVLLGDHENGWVCLFGLKCSSWTTMNCGTSGRTPCTAIGNLAYQSVVEGNLLASRNFGGLYCMYCVG